MTKKRFMLNMIEFSKFCDEKEILLADELWSFLSGETETMKELLDLIRCIAKPNFAENFDFLNDINNLFCKPSEYLELLNKWCLYDDVTIAQKALAIKSDPAKKIEKSFYLHLFADDGRYNENRAKKLL